MNQTTKSNTRKHSKTSFPGSRQYWERRYRSGRTSGKGSYGRLAEFKAGILDAFVSNNQIGSVIEWGCGDGNQLSLSNYPKYLGLDVSETCIAMCRERFSHDATKKFELYDPLTIGDGHRRNYADLALSLDVIYHLIEDEIYEKYMFHLFDSTRAFVIIYSSNTSGNDSPARHLKHREFTSWIADKCHRWKLACKVDNPYPFDPKNPHSTSFSDFYFFEKSS